VVLAGVLLEPLLEFLPAEVVLLSAVVLHGEGGADPSHSSALFDAPAFNQSFNQTGPVGIAGTGRIQNLLCFSGRDVNLTVSSTDLFSQGRSC